MRLIDVSRDLATEAQCYDYLEAVRWPQGVRCVACGHSQVSRFERQSKPSRTHPEGLLRRMHQCLNPACRKQFSATVGTIFEDTHLPLPKWFLAIALMVDAKKGLSAFQMQRHLGTTYKTAWFLCHRIRKAMEPGAGGLLTGVIEVDETYVGGKYDKRRKRQRWDKAPVVGIAERQGEMRAFVPKAVNSFVVLRSIRDNVAPDAEMVCTDESPLYARLGGTHEHQTVHHTIKEYVRGSVHTQTVDGFWGLFKRRLIGSHHQVSVKHLHRYLNEAVYSYNGRERRAELFRATMRGMATGTALRYKALTADPAEPGPEE